MVVPGTKISSVSRSLPCLQCQHFVTMGSSEGEPFLLKREIDQRSLGSLLAFTTLAVFSLLSRRVAFIGAVRDIPKTSEIPTNTT